MAAPLTTSRFDERLLYSGTEDDYKFFVSADETESGYTSMTSV